VRIGNAASNQFQLDVYGEVLAAMWQADRAGIKMTEPDWALMIELVKFLESHWQKPDEGIWEVRGGPQHFTHSKMMAWLACDRAGTDGRRPGVALSAARMRRGWVAGTGRRFSSVLFLAGHVLASHRAKKRSPRIVRAPARSA